MEEPTHSVGALPAVCPGLRRAGNSRRMALPDGAARRVDGGGRAMTRLNLDHIGAFLAVVRAGGVRQAAGVLHLSQPAVTARIHNLEATLARRLFDRGAARMTLTREGEKFLAYAEKFEHLCDLVEREVIAPESLDGWLRIGASETITQCWLPDLVFRLHQTFPRVQVELNVDISTNLRTALIAREIDLALLLGPVSEYSVDNVDLPEFALAWYAGAGTEPPRGDPADYLTRPIITYARNTRPYRELRMLLMERVGPQASIFASSSLSACFRLVEAGLGVAALPVALGRPLEVAGRLRRFDPGWLPSPLRFTASYLGAPRSHLVETAARMACAVAGEYAISNPDHT